METITEIITNSPAWQAHYPDLGEEYTDKVIAQTLAHFPNLRNMQVEVAVLHTDDTEIQKLNSDFRGKDKPTNVLSFPDIQYDYRNFKEQIFAEKHLYLGDIAFAIETIVREADEQGKTLIAHYTHLLVHSLLHLVGYDHLEDDDAEIMEKLEIDILAEFSMNSPY